MGTFMPVAELEQTVLSELDQLSKQYLDQAALERNVEFASDLQKRRSDLLANIAAYEKRIEECSRGIRELYKDKVKGILNESDFAELLEAFRTDRDLSARLVATSQTELQELEQRLAAGDNRRELIERYINPNHLTREIVDVLIDHIVIYRRDPKTTQIPVDIYWNF